MFENLRFSIGILGNGNANGSFGTISEASQGSFFQTIQREISEGNFVEELLQDKFAE